MISRVKISKVSGVIGKNFKTSYDGKNSTVFVLDKSPVVVKYVKNKRYFKKEILGYDALVNYYGNHFPKRLWVNPEISLIAYEKIILPSLKDLIVNKTADDFTEAYGRFVEELFKIVLLTKKVGSPNKSGKYFYDAFWHISRLIDDNYVFKLTNGIVNAESLMSEAVIVNEKVYSCLDDALHEAKEKYQHLLPKFTVSLHGDENHSNIFLDTFKPDKWYLIDPQWFVPRADWIILVAELFNGWKTYSYFNDGSGVTSEINNDKLLLKYDLHKDNSTILRDMDRILFVKAKLLAEELGDENWFQRFKSFYLFRSVRGGLWGNLGNQKILSVSLGEGLRIYNARSVEDLLEGL